VGLEINSFSYIFFNRMIDNSRVGLSFARKRTIGGRRGGHFNGGGGDRYSRGGGGGGGDYDSSRNRRRYSPRQSDDTRDRYNKNYILLKYVILFI
jgi:hypothetical protein